MKILVRLGADLVIKSDRVRSRFQARMIKNMKFGFKRSGVNADVTTKWARLFVEVNDRDVPLAKEVLLNTFGISSISLIEHICEPNVEEIIKSGKADLVSFGRKFINSPTWLIKELLYYKKKTNLPNQYKRCF